MFLGVEKERIGNKWVEDLFSKLNLVPVIS